jgi:hypothetical protein
VSRFLGKQDGKRCEIEPEVGGNVGTTERIVGVKKSAKGAARGAARGAA